MEQQEAIEIVQQGIDWLDEVQPDWVSRINLDTLDLFKPKQCILGQVFADEAKKMQEIHYNLSGFSWAILYRDLRDGPLDAFNFRLKDLEPYWIAAINKRKHDG